MVGGGARGKVAGTAPVITTGVGPIMEMSQVFISTSTRVGEDTTEAVTGTDTGGTMNEFLTDDLNRTGRVGMTIDIGNGKEPGVCRTIDRDRSRRDRN